MKSRQLAYERAAARRLIELSRTGCRRRIGSWQCSRDAGPDGYCDQHRPPGLFRVKYMWPVDRHNPGGKVRYCAGSALTADPDRASVYTYEQAYDIVYNKSRDAFLVWRIVATLEHIS